LIIFEARIVGKQWEISVVESYYIVVSVYYQPNNSSFIVRDGCGKWKSITRHSRWAAHAAEEEDLGLEDECSSRQI
jgi:hypothetical protein